MAVRGAMKVLAAAFLWLLALHCAPAWATPLASVDPPAVSPARQQKPISAFYRETWTTRQGLPHNQINAIAQTPDGYLWLGTWEGLVRYNGLEFQQYARRNTPALKDNGVRSLRASSDGAVVIGTSRGGVTVKRGDRWRTWTRADGLALLARALRLHAGLAGLHGPGLHGHAEPLGEPLHELFHLLALVAVARARYPLCL